MLGARETGEGLGRQVTVSQAMQEKASRTSRQGVQVEEGERRRWRGRRRGYLWLLGQWSMGGWPFPVPALRRARMTDGTALCQARRVPLQAGLLLIGRRLRWIRLRTRLSFKGRVACSAAAQPLMPGGSSGRLGRREWQGKQHEPPRGGCTDQCPPNCPCPPKICPPYFPAAVNFFNLAPNPTPSSPKDSPPPASLLRTRRASLRHAVKSIELSCSSTNTNSESHPPA